MRNYLYLHGDTIMSNSTVIGYHRNHSPEWYREKLIMLRHSKNGRSTHPVASSVCFVYLNFHMAAHGIATSSFPWLQHRILHPIHWQQLCAAFKKVYSIYMQLATLAQT